MGVERMQMSAEPVEECDLRRMFPVQFTVDSQFLLSKTETEHGKPPSNSIRDVMHLFRISSGK